MAKQRAPRTAPAHIAPASRVPPVLTQASQFVLLEREVEEEFRPQMLAALQERVNAVGESTHAKPPICSTCQQAMGHHDTRRVSWIARFGRLGAEIARYRCGRCHRESRPLLDVLGVEPGRISGSLARWLALLAVIVPYPLAAELADLLLGVKISAMGVWRVAQRLGEAAASYSEELSRYHAGSHSEGVETQAAPPTVVVGLDGCSLGMQVRQQRRQLSAGIEPEPLPPIEEGHFREVKSGVVLLPDERTETSPGRRSLVRRFLVSCLGDADAIYARLWAQLQELGWLGADTVVVIVGDGAEWIWNRAPMFARRCEILDFWHAIEYAWKFARLRYGDGTKQARAWVHQIAADLRDGKVLEVIARLERLRPRSPELRESLQKVIDYYRDNAPRMRYDEYLRLGYGIGSGAIESAHKQIVHARFRQAGMRWSELGARRLLALRLLLLNHDWGRLDRLRMVAVTA